MRGHVPLAPLRQVAGLRGADVPADERDLRLPPVLPVLPPRRIAASFAAAVAATAVAAAALAVAAATAVAAPTFAIPATAKGADPRSRLLRCDRALRAGYTDLELEP